MKLKLRDETLGVSFWIGLVFGWAVIAFGVYTVFKNKGPDNPTYSLELALGANIFHDAIVAPAACVFAFIFSKILPHPMRRIINWGLFSSAITVLIAYPAIRGFGRKADNPTVLPLNYATATWTVIGVIWAVVIGLCVYQATQNFRQRKVLASK